MKTYFFTFRFANDSFLNVHSSLISILSLDKSPVYKDNNLSICFLVFTITILQFFNLQKYYQRINNYYLKKIEIKLSYQVKSSQKTFSPIT